MGNRSLRAIRKGAPEQDRNGPALASDPLPYWATARDGSRYVHVSLYPRTPNELRRFCRGFGRPAAREAEWSCVITWLMKDYPAPPIRNPYQVAITAIGMVQEYDRMRFGWPTHDGKERPLARLAFLTPDVREEALRVAAETLSDWRNAARPYLEPRRIKAAYQYLISCPAFKDKYIKEQE